MVNSGCAVIIKTDKSRWRRQQLLLRITTASEPESSNCRRLPALLLLGMSNSILTAVYWEIGRRIVETEQAPGSSDASLFRSTVQGGFRAAS